RDRSTLSLHDALPISKASSRRGRGGSPGRSAGHDYGASLVKSTDATSATNGSLRAITARCAGWRWYARSASTESNAMISTTSQRSEEHTSELQSRENL